MANQQLQRKKKLQKIKYTNNLTAFTQQLVLVQSGIYVTTMNLNLAKESLRL